MPVTINSSAQLQRIVTYTCSSFKPESSDTAQALRERNREEVDEEKRKEKGGEKREKSKKKINNRKGLIKLMLQIKRQIISQFN